jgi:hypothetical protein
MRFTITLTAATDDRPTSGISIAVIERDDDTLTIDDLGLRIAESKRLLAALQLAVVQTQALDWCRRQRACPCCGSARQIKDHRSIMVRTPFGKIAVPSTRFRRCTCKPTAGIAAPIVAALPERVTPDLLELEARWASLASYGITAERLADVLPIGDAINATTIRQDTLRVAERLEAELGTERRCFIEGCEADWTDGPLPGPPVTVGIDGGYVRSWYDRPNNFEVIVGKSVVDPGEDGEISEPTRRFGFVVGHDDRPRRRLHELLLEQGVGMDREITFMSDGGRNVRNLQWDMRPNAEHVLDYFHIAMRVTVMQQIARGLPPPSETDKDVAVATLERVRHFLWHGNWRRARPNRRRRDQNAWCDRSGCHRRADEPPTGLAASSQSPQAFAGVRKLYQRQCQHDPELWRATTIWRSSLDRLRGIDRQPGRRKALRKEATDAVDAQRGASACATPRPYP